MFLLPYIRERLIEPKVRTEKVHYNLLNENEIINFQLNKFNALWKNIQNNVPYYKRLVEENKVPRKITCIEEFKQLPIIDRKFANENMELLTDDSKKPDSWITTGGSTGTPLKCPSWKSEYYDCEPSIWYGRSFYHIKRSDKMFRLWGHSHTLGTGITRLKNKLKFQIGLPLVGYKRFSAYDLSDERLRQAGKEIIRFKPKYIIGYSKAIYLLAKANEERKHEFHQLNLKAVIGAAEGFDSNKDKEYVSEIFGCPVGLQYATMEAKHLAHTHPDGGYKVFWRNNLIECIDEHGEPSIDGRIIVTTLYPRAFPLIRYEIGDIITGARKSVESVYSFNDVKGRNNDYLFLDENTPIHSESISHAIKFSEKVSAYQIRFTEDLKYTIYIKSNVEITENDINEIKSRLNQIDKRLSKIEIKQVEQLKQTIAGKTKWLMKE